MSFTDNRYERWLLHAELDLLLRYGWVGARRARANEVGGLVNRYRLVDERVAEVPSEAASDPASIPAAEPDRRT